MAERNNRAEREPEHQASPATSFPVVGVGASAGGLEAFSQLLEALPEETQAAFIFVQHLDPSHESMLVELLSRAAKIPVVQAEDGATVEPGRAYVSPPRVTVTVAGGRLRLEEAPPTPAGMRMPIDVFFRSLARDQYNRAIGVILSGTGTDGTLGLRDIKEWGGLAFVQAVQTAKFAGMPQSAIAHTSVDAILPPAGIAQTLTGLAAHPYIAGAAPDIAVEEPQAPASTDGLAHLLRLLHLSHRVDFANYKVSTILRRATRRMALLGLEDLDAYARYCEEHPDELAALYHDLLIKVTGFFRDPGSFDALKETVLPALFQDRPPGRPFRAWVPGCATGEEAYSIAMVLFEWLAEQRMAPPAVQIFATDVNEAALATARAGAYVENIALDVSPERLERFFTQVDHTYQVVKSVREVCTFARHDLLRDPPFSGLDLISCRNLLMYLDAPAQRRIVSNFHYALRPGGYLMVGAAETVGDATGCFTPVDGKFKVYARQPAAPAKPITPPIHGLQGTSERPSSRLARAVEDESTPHEAPMREDGEMYREADRALLACYAPPGVLVNEHLDILQFRGDTSHYLLPSPGRASLNLLNMAREGLISDLRAAIEEAKRTHDPAIRQGATVSYEGEFLDVTVRVIPVRPRGGGQHYLVAFEEPGATVAPPPRRRRRPPSRSDAERQIEQLRNELEAAREYLQTAIEERDAFNEELKSANEEILSANEELQSTNEELETATEELQSTNEELTTSNEELQRRNQELIQRTDDLDNLFDSGHLPVVHLGEDLRIRHFSNAARNVLNVIPTDVGRPVTDLRLNIRAPDLERMLRRVMGAGEPVDREVQDQSGQWHILRLRPYWASDGRITGAVLFLIDIDSMKDAERLTRLLEEQERAKALVEDALEYVEDVVSTLPEPFLILDEDLRVLDANDVFHQTFRVSVEETVGRHLTDLGDGQWDIPELREWLDRVVKENRQFRDYEVTHEFKDIGRRTMLLDGLRIQRDHLPEPGDRLLLSIRDITARKQAEEALRRSEERLQRVLATDAVGVLFFDEQSGVLIDANDAFLQLTGYTREEVEAGELDWRRMTPPEYVAESLRQLEHLEATGRIGPYEKEYYHKDGSRSWMLFTGASLGDGAIVEFAIDITERERLREADRRKDEFLAMLSHELRNPLAAMQAALEMLHEAGEELSMRQEAIGVFGHQMANIKRLVDDLLDVSRVTRGRIHLRGSDCDLNEIVRRAVDPLRRDSVDRGQELLLSLPQQVVWVHGDASRLEQVVINLVSNATKYTPSGGTIQVGVEQDDGQALVRVRDSGRGMEPSELAAVFDLFWQGEQPLDRPQSGLGIGLPLVKRLVEMHGGTITAASEGPGRGSEFTVRLPTVPAPQGPSQALGAEAPAAAPERPLRVLLVDDNDDMAGLFARLLQKMGHEVRTAQDGPQALEALREFMPDAVLLDIGLPGMDGYEVARRMRQEPAGQNAVLVAVTGYGQESDRRHSQEAGFDHHLVKPAGQDEIRRILSAAAEAKRPGR